ncbi:GyrI-like domain-containing protein [Marinisporobacter balticus]|uniref:Effector-binding domain-containing protein n=1 Tax=Marinisporobacter balticus TaxID=2018667 RepID=A0A4R2L454_9FIRM|nr:GyrI-like domain-containing protein [Marinisporobacter balticus]TCO77378.1 effector-binding domain-containing protein [Marinisporobacter balticus]
MDYKFELTDQSVQPVLSIRTRTAVGNLPNECGKAYGAIMQYLNEMGEKPADVPFIAYYNMDMEDLDIELGFPISKPLAGKGEIKLSEIPAGKQVACMYKGPYKEMEPVYNAMMQWISENGYSPTGVAYEFYYNSPMDVPETELLTKVVFPIK